MAKQKAFERIFIIILENQLQSAALDNGFMKSLASEGVRLSNYFGITHPSQPNYIAAIAGLPFVTDDNPINFRIRALSICWKQKTRLGRLTWKTCRKTIRPSRARVF